MSGIIAEDQNIKGRKIKGFFGMFDILGYRDLIEHNELDDVIGIYYSSIFRRDLLAFACGNSHTINLSPSVQAKKLVFSDTFIFYQEFFNEENSIAKLQRTFAFLIYSSYLLRFAFDAGVPLRGAISFGEYYIDDENNCFLGKPVIEAYDVSNKQQWSGTVICNSAMVVINNIINDENVKEYISQTNTSCEIDELCDKEINELIIEYEIPYKGHPSKGMVLRWDDFIARNLFALGLSNINACGNQHIIREVRNAFSAHNKEIREVEDKIENTSNFLRYINEIYSRDFSINEKFPTGSFKPHKIRS